jgi:hypothetical protein
LLVLSLMKLSMLTLLIPLVMLALSAWCLPFAQGNLFVSKLAHSLASPGPEKNSFVVQLTLYPRLHRNFRAFIEDADDVGCLSFGETELVYAGDAVRLRLPYSQIKQIQLHNVGLRGLFVSGRRIELAVSGIEQVQFLEIAERSTLLLPASKKITAELHQQLASKVR